MPGFMKVASLSHRRTEGISPFFFRPAFANPILRNCSWIVLPAPSWSGKSATTYATEPLEVGEEILQGVVSEVVGKLPDPAREVHVVAVLHADAAGIVDIEAEPVVDAEADENVAPGLKTEATWASGTISKFPAFIE